MDFATALKAAREQMGLTQTELGKALLILDYKVQKSIT